MNVIRYGGLVQDVSCFRGCLCVQCDPGIPLGHRQAVAACHELLIFRHRVELHGPAGHYALRRYNERFDGRRSIPCGTSFLAGSLAVYSNDACAWTRLSVGTSDHTVRPELASKAVLFQPEVKRERYADADTVGFQFCRTAFASGQRRGIEVVGISFDSYGNNTSGFLEWSIAR